VLRALFFIEITSFVGTAAEAADCFYLVFYICFATDGLVLDPSLKVAKLFLRKITMEAARF
jgi:hypothetical protein